MDSIPSVGDRVKLAYVEVLGLVGSFCFAFEKVFTELNVTQIVT